MSDLLLHERSNTLKTLEVVIEFTETENFKKLVQELYSLEGTKRKDFIRDIVLSRDQMLKRGIAVPEDISIERSVFFDDRPTLFCVVKYLEDDDRKKVTVTF